MFKTPKFPAQATGGLPARIGTRFENDPVASEASLPRNAVIVRANARLGEEMKKATRG